MLCIHLSSQATEPTSVLRLRDMSLLYSICMLQRTIKSQTFPTSNLCNSLTETRPWAFMAPQAAKVVGKHQRGETSTLSPPVPVTQGLDALSTRLKQA